MHDKLDKILITAILGLFVIAVGLYSYNQFMVAHHLSQYQEEMEAEEEEPDVIGAPIKISVSGTTFTVPTTYEGMTLVFEPNPQPTSTPTPEPDIPLEEGSGRLLGVKP